MSREQDCVDRIAKDLARIQEEYISNGQYGIAGIELENALDRASYSEMRDNIRENLHMGPSFCASLDGLLKDLKKDRPRKELVGVALRHFKAYAVQTRLPRRD